MAEKEIILELDYRISPEDFYTFSVRSMNRQYAARAKKTNFTGILKLEHIREKSDFLLSNMAFFFIPAGVSMINYLDILIENLVPILVISVVSTFITFIAAALSIRLTLKLMNGGKHHA